MNGCPDCDARRKAEEASLRAIKEAADARAIEHQRDQDYLAGLVGGGLTLGLPAVWIQDLLEIKSNAHLGFMLIGCVLGVAWVYCRRNPVGR